MFSLFQVDYLTFLPVFSFHHIHSPNVGLTQESCIWVHDVISNKSNSNWKASGISLSEVAKLNKPNSHPSGSQWRLAPFWLKWFHAKWHENDMRRLFSWAPYWTGSPTFLPAGPHCRVSDMERPVARAHAGVDVKQPDSCLVGVSVRCSQRHWRHKSPCLLRRQPVDQGAGSNSRQHRHRPPLH